MAEYELALIEPSIDYGEPTARFWQEFPDGKVPITNTKHLMPMDVGLYQGLLNTLTVFEYEKIYRPVDAKVTWKPEEVEAIEAAVKVRRDSQRRHNDRRDENRLRAEYKRQVRTLLALDAPLAALIDALGERPERIAKCWTDDSGVPDRRDWVDADYAMRAGEPCGALARREGLGMSAFRHFAELRGYCESEESLVQRIRDRMTSDCVARWTAAKLERAYINDQGLGVDRLVRKMKDEDK